MKTNRKSHSSYRKTSLVAGLVLALGLFTGNGNAQWVVTDPGHTIGTGLDMAQSAVEFGEQLSRWQRQLQEFEDALTSVTSIMQNPSSLIPVSVSSDMKSVAENAGDDVHCPSATGLSLSPAELFSTVLNSFGKEDLVKEQNTLCLQANHLRNMKYNEAKKMVDESRERSAKLSEFVSQTRDGSKSEGSYRAAMLSAQVLMSSTLVDMQYAKVRLDAYDAMIARVESDSDALAKQMMQGKKNQNPISALITDVISTAALAEGLDSARTRRISTNGQN